MKTSTPSTNSVIKSSIKYGIAGGIIGLFAGIILVLYKFVNSGIIISGKQVEGVLKLVLLGNVSDKETDYSVTVANIGNAINGMEKVLLLDKNNTPLAERLIDNIKENTNKKSILLGTDLYENVDTSNNLATADGVIVGVDKEKTTIKELERDLAKISSLNKHICGFVLFE